VVGVPGHVVAFQDPGDDTVIHLPDPEWDRIQALEDRVKELEERVAALQQERQPSGEGQNEAL
jgi:hypothetical protein